MEHTTTHDADLVAAASAGDTTAFAAIYDRYADPVFTMCTHLLSSAEEAADVCGDVFLVAAERLHQLRDPSRLRSWLFAIARRQVFLRTHRRSRSVPVAQVADVIDQTPDPVDSAVMSEELTAVVRQASSGLDEGDRVVLALSLQGLVGADLADALGVPAASAYQADHRMRRRLERSVGALLVARGGRADCPALAGLLRRWDGTFSVLWRKRVARHIDRFEVCERRRRLVPAMLFDGAAGASPLAAAPISVRSRVLEAARFGASPVRRWSRDGFPPPDRGRWRRPVTAAVVVMVLLILWAGAVAMGGAGPDEEVLVGAAESLTSGQRPASTTTVPAPVRTPPPVGEPAGPQPSGEGAAPPSSVPAGTPSTTTSAVRHPTIPSTTIPRPPARSPARPPARSPAPDPRSGPTTTTATTPPAVPPPTLSAPTVDAFAAYDGTSPCPKPKFDVTLKWATTGATSVTIVSGKTMLSGLSADGTAWACAPPGSTWTLTATGPGGTDTATVVGF